MNTTRIKAYAPIARKEFIQLVTAKANILGLSDSEIQPAEVKGDVAIINGRAYPRHVEDLRQRIIHRIQREGFSNVIEAIAYTWFNRFMALRYMELHDYLDHGYRVLSNRSGSDTPEIIENAGDIDLPGLDKERAVELRLAGDKDSELYQMLAVAQCNALHKAMPFLFESIDDETELLIPENLLHSDSPVRKMVNEIDEEDWQEVEVVGWIYQFYISEKKDELMKAKKAYKPEEIPAVTQLFTPNWIVKYLVENSLGRTWVATYPESELKQKMEYYIDPAEQEPEVQKQLEEITPKELNPEELTVLDPACGSGHILVEAYNVFREIYQERGYRTREIPRIILEKNLYGLEIDDRAAQLAGFALLMKARADDRSILRDPPKLNIISIQGSESVDAEKIADALLSKGSRDLLGTTIQQETEEQTSEISKQDILELIELFRLGKTLGSLIQVPQERQQKLPAIQNLVQNSIQTGDTYERAAARTLEPYIQQALLLSKKYDCVIANPPYMGSKYFSAQLKDFAKTSFPNSKSDLFAIFIERLPSLLGSYGYTGNVSPFVWMFISSYEKLRNCLFDNNSVVSLVKPSYTSFFQSAIVPLVTFIIQKGINDYKGRYFDLGYLGSAESQPPKLKLAISEFIGDMSHIASWNDFKKIPGSPIAFWVSDIVRDLFQLPNLSEFSDICAGMSTTDNNQFLRNWYEVSHSNTAFNTKNREETLQNKRKWYPYNKGGSYRKWFGNNQLVVNWKNDGEDIRDCIASDPAKQVGGRIVNSEYFFRQSVTWSSLSSSYLSARFSGQGFIFDSKGNSLFSNSNDQLYYYLAFLNTVLTKELLSILAPTLDFNPGSIAKLPFRQEIINNKSIYEFSIRTIQLTKTDWDSYESSWDFKKFPWISDTLKGSTLQESFNNWKNHSVEQTQKMKELEEENNRIFIEAYGLEDELTPDVPEEQITLTVNPKYRYGANYTEEELWDRFREDSIKELISYSIGCMMGRYSLDEPGLIYANSGNDGFDLSKYSSFPADDDGIVPVMDLDWFEDDATNRFIEFIKTVWSEETLEDNLQFVADSLGKKKGETPIDSIRKYISNSFFKDQLKTYKKRPIYWLFSSGKNKAFECLVYLHRYNEAILSRMRSEYVTPLQGKLSSRIEYLNNEIENAENTSAKRKLEKELSTYLKKQEELRKFDEELRHYADMRIGLDLDDGVKVNYGKFGNLLAERKTISGK